MAHTLPPTGPGLVSISLRIDPEDEVVLWGFLLGDDGLASAHGDHDGTVMLLTTESRASELHAWLEDIGPELPSLRVLRSPAV
jgi:hypothetical protein